MRSIISDIGRYLRTRFVYTTNFGMISEPSSDMAEEEHMHAMLIRGPR